MTLFDPPEQSAAPRGPLVRVRLTVAYDGSGFHGFAANVGVRTVAGTLLDAIRRVVGHPVELACAGRTDKGVHARGQVVSFDVTEGTDLTALVRSLNHLCGPEVAVRDPEVVAPDFDARRSALARHYRYLVLNRPAPDPFLADRAWHVEAPLDLAALRLACDPLVGEHDFSAFCRRPKPPGKASAPWVEASLVRRVLDARWSAEPASGAEGSWAAGTGDVLRFDISATAFCHQMVRSIVGTMVDMGRGRRSPGEMAAVLRSRDRATAGDLAPPHGLALWSVRY